jgi:hypothetical protein
MQEIAAETLIKIIFFILHKKKTSIFQIIPAVRAETEDSLCLQLPVAADETCRGAATRETQRNDALSSSISRHSNISRKVFKNMKTLEGRFEPHDTRSRFTLIRKRHV